MIWELVEIPHRSWMASQISTTAAHTKFENTLCHLQTIVVTIPARGLVATVQAKAFLYSHHKCCPAGKCQLVNHRHSWTQNKGGVTALARYIHSLKSDFSLGGGHTHTSTWWEEFATIRYTMKCFSHPNLPTLLLATLFLLAILLPLLPTSI